MSSNCTITRLVRWRVKDFASCFFACGLPLGDGTGKSSKVTSKRPNRSMLYDSQGSNRDCEWSRNVKKMQDGSSAAIRPDANDGTDSEWPSFAEEEYIVFGFREGNPSEAFDGDKSCTSMHVHTQADEERSNEAELDWPPDEVKEVNPSFAEEEYIVFGFREDGEIYMINEGNPSEAFDGDNKSCTSMHVHTQADEERSNEAELDWPPDEVNEVNPVVEDSCGTKMDSFESCHSNLSDESTSSFAFPVLGKEWIGSPVQMPRSYKHKNDESVHLNCCTF